MRILRLFLLLLCALPAWAAPLQSGPEVGGNTPPFHPTHVTGPDAGTDVCPV